MAPYWQKMLMSARKNLKNVYYTANECDKDIFCVGDEKVFASTSVVMAFNTALAFISKPSR